jgi:hypothetical protein
MRRCRRQPTGPAYRAWHRNAGRTWTSRHCAPRTPYNALAWLPLRREVTRSPRCILGRTSLAPVSRDRTAHMLASPSLVSVATCPQASIRPAPCAIHDRGVAYSSGIHLPQIWTCRPKLTIRHWPQNAWGTTPEAAGRVAGLSARVATAPRLTQIDPNADPNPGVA